jgi:hypothetical protein
MQLDYWTALMILWSLVNLQLAFGSEHQQENKQQEQHKPAEEGENTAAAAEMAIDNKDTGAGASLIEGGYEGEDAAGMNNKKMFHTSKRDWSSLHNTWGKRGAGGWNNLQVKASYLRFIYFIINSRFIIEDAHLSNQYIYITYTDMHNVVARQLTTFLAFFVLRHICLVHYILYTVGRLGETRF